MNFKGIIKGLHHVTATVHDAQEDYDFYTKTLGLRLVKETVNFDNEKVYHFYYANKQGTPSTVFTTFPYKDRGVRKGTIGTGQVSHTAFSVPVGSLLFWKNRLDTFQVSYQLKPIFGRPCLSFKDPSGLKLQLVEFENDTREPLWTTNEVSKQAAIRGIAYTILLVEDAQETGAFLRTFGYALRGQEGNIQWYEAGDGGPGNIVLLQGADGEPKGKNGLGTVHHVAHRVAGLGEIEQIRRFVEDSGRKVTEVKDRKYFKSIYFRIPGGVLFEVATEGPGFTVDEDIDALGTTLKLPDWQEVHRDRIEKNLLPYTR